MANDNSNMIRPVAGLQTITGLTPTKRREGSKRRQSLQQEKDESSEEKEIQSEEQTENGNNLNTSGIDYCA